MNYRSVADLNAVILRALPGLPRDVDAVVGIPRSGLLAASLVALYLNKPLADLEGFLQGRLLGSGARLIQPGNQSASRQAVRILLVDDSVQTGREFAKAREQLRQAGVRGEILSFCVFAAPSAVSLVDYCGETCSLPRVFEWNLMHHPHLEFCCVDIDGVLCRDPRPDENDDGPAYEHFLKTVEPLIVPTVTLGWLVTSRLEKYRRLTTDWLARHRFRYRELFMMQHPDKSARVAAGDHADYKAGIYQSTGAILFIESSLQQANQIAHIARRPVFCMESRTMIQLGGLAEHRVQPGQPAAPDLRALDAVRWEIERIVARHEPFILVDEDQLRWSMPDSRAIPFLERHGEYWGPPSDGETAVRECERLRGKGARYLVFAWPAFWWLRHYHVLREHLDRYYPCLCDNQYLKVFDLRK